jgi:hypothetical protein
MPISPTAGIILLLYFALPSIEEHDNYSHFFCIDEVQAAKILVRY